MRPLSELDSAYLAAHAQSRDLHRPVVAAVRPDEGAPVQTITDQEDPR